jgi:hypothetical protein
MVPRIWDVTAFENGRGASLSFEGSRGSHHEKGFRGVRAQY